MNLFRPYRFLKPELIEAEANQVLRQMQVAQRLKPNAAVDPNLVAEFLGLDILWDYIPPDALGEIVARILPLKRLIEINETIVESCVGFHHSTIAHEVGHWVLHINQDEAQGLTEQQSLNFDISLDEVAQPFLCRSLNASAGIEWQAQYFASCLLMPRHLLATVSQGRNLTNQQHLRAMADELNVTPANLKNRLVKMGIIDIPKGSKQIYWGQAAAQNQENLFNECCCLTGPGSVI